MTRNRRGNDPMHFFVACEPPTATQQEKGIRIVEVNGKRVPRTYPKPSWERARDYIKSRLAAFAPDDPIEKGSPVLLSVTWCFANEGEVDGTPHIVKPDTDNLDKGLKDIMTALGWWDDDAQVFSEHIVKVWSRVPGIRIDIDVLEDSDMITCEGPNLAYQAEVEYDTAEERWERWAKSTKCSDTACDHYFANEKVGYAFCTWLEEFIRIDSTPYENDCSNDDWGVR